MALKLGEFGPHDWMMDYNTFVPRLFNLCLSYGFEPGKIMPSRAFCSDENQGFPSILIAKHFGSFPFDHGRVGGIVSAGRHGPHAHHGKDLVIIQASHVGYDPQTRHFGTYRRLQTDDHVLSSSCGKICAVLDWYVEEFKFAQNSILFTTMGHDKVAIIDNQLLDADRESGIFLNLDQFIAMPGGVMPEPVHVFSTSRAFRVAPDLATSLPADYFSSDMRTPIGERLAADLFYFKRPLSGAPDAKNHLERNLSSSMSKIVTSDSPPLSAAQANSQIEFDRIYRTIIKEHEYQGRNLIFVAGVNIDISPKEGQLFPTTKFVPWAGYIQTRSGQRLLLEQDGLVEALNSQSDENPHQFDLERAIAAMTERQVRAMLVDDEEELVDALSKRLRARRVGVTVAYDGPTALGLVDQDEPEVMVLDLNMPGMNGIEVLKRVRKSHPNIRVVILTGYATEADRKRCMDLGAHAFLEKPLNMEELDRVLRQPANPGTKPEDLK